MRLVANVYLTPIDNLGEDCPVFDNLFEFCQMYAGGTIGKLCWLWCKWNNNA